MDPLPSPVTLVTGADARFRGAPSPLAVVCVNGGQAAEVAGTWSASLEWLVGRIAPAFPNVRFAEVRYRVKSWRRLDDCVADALAAVEAVDAHRTLLVGFSMGGAVAVRAAPHPSVVGVLGLAPWLPDELELTPLNGRRLDVLHGALDRWLPGIPGVSPGSSRRGFARARSLGVEGSYTIIPGAVHGIALRAPSGRLIALPRAERWATLAAETVARFEADADVRRGERGHRSSGGASSGLRVPGHLDLASEVGEG